MFPYRYTVYVFVCAHGAGGLSISVSLKALCGE